MDIYMDDVLDAIAFLDVQTSVLCTILCLLWLYYLLRKPPGLPPGPHWRKPILGHLREFTKHGPNLRRVLDRYRRKYGEVYCLYLGRRLVVIVNGLDAMREAFVARGEEFGHRPDTLVQRARDKQYGLRKVNGETKKPSPELTFKTLKTLGLLKVNGEAKEPSPELTFKTLKTLGFDDSWIEDSIQDEITLLLDDVTGYNTTTFSPKHILTTSVFNVNCSIVLGTKYSHDHPEFQHVLSLMRKCYAAAGSTSLLNFLPFLRYLPGDFFRFKEFQALAREMNDYFVERIEICKKQLDDADKGFNLVSAFLSLSKENETGDAELKVVLGDLFAAGSETTATTLCRAISYLINFPEIQERVYQEISSHVGANRKPRLSDRDDLLYTNAFIMETQRLTDMPILSLPHTVQEDVSFRGFTVPKGSVVFPDTQAVLSDPTMWGDPKVFRPGRFFAENGDLKSLEGFIPYFVGQRSPIGESLAQMELFLFVSSLVQKFEFCSPTDESSDSDQPRKRGVTVRQRATEKK